MAVDNICCLPLYWAINRILRNWRISGNNRREALELKIQGVDRLGSIH